MKPKYRVEAYIVPRCNSEDESCSSNEIDDVKAANKLKLVSTLNESEKIDESSGSSEESADKVELEISDRLDVDEPIYDVPYYEKPRLCNVKEDSKFKTYSMMELPKIPIRTSSLTSIDERGETEGILEEFCFHGYKNGCTAAAQNPEEVSEEIFKDNWLRRLEGLRERETVLRDKESLLQERERLLFKKEKELRILERLVRDKLKQVELYLKRCKSSQSIESANFDAKTKSSEGSRDSQSQSSRSGKNDQKSLTHDTIDVVKSISSISSEYLTEENSLKNPPNSRSSLTGASAFVANAVTVKSHGRSSTFSAKTSFGGISSYSSLRCKPKPKISYDDLDSTLSADIGDSSFVVTSRKFDPVVFKKPYAFTRSASERRTKLDQDRNVGLQGTFADDKIMKRVSENIHISQDKSTKYQDYGLIDPAVNTKEFENRRHSYLSLECGNDAPKGRNSRGITERPISWNEETNEWLQKKRHAYNIATKRIPNENFENKENCDAKCNKSDKCTKKKDSKSKKFTIFR